MWCEIHDRDIWNALVLGLPNCDLRQGYEWGKARASQGWQPHRLAVFQADVCVAAVSLLVRRLPLLGWSILYAPGGPLLHDAMPDPAWHELLEGIHRIAGQSKAIFLRADPKILHQAQAFRQAMLSHRFLLLSEDWTTWNTPRIVMTMDIRGSEAILKQKVRKRYREYIASAPKRGLTVRPALSMEEAQEFHTSLAMAGRRKRLPVRGYTYFEQLWREYLQPGRGVLLVAEYRGTPVGGLLGVKFGQEAYMLYVTLRERLDGVRMHQGPPLYWEFVRWAKACGCDTVNWGGIGTRFPPQEDDPGFGVYRFKAGFNSSLEYLSGYYDLIFSRVRYRIFRFFERWGGALVWIVRAQLNGRFAQLRVYMRAVMGKGRQFCISMQQRGIGTTLYWAAFGYLKPNRFVLLANDLLQTQMPQAPRHGVCLDVWPASTLQAWRAERRGLSTEFFQDQIDGVDTCAVALVRGELAGLIWVYLPDDTSRLFSLCEREAELNHGYVLPAFRGTGLFKEVISLACCWLKKQGYRTVYAGVHAANGPSLRAFRHVGFCDIGSVRHFLVFRAKRDGGQFQRAAMTLDMSGEDQ